MAVYHLLASFVPNFYPSEGSLRQMSVLAVSFLTRLNVLTYLSLAQSHCLSVCPSVCPSVSASLSLRVYEFRLVDAKRDAPN